MALSETQIDNCALHILINCREKYTVHTYFVLVLIPNQHCPLAVEIIVKASWASEQLVEFIVKQWNYIKKLSNVLSEVADTQAGNGTLTLTERNTTSFKCNKPNKKPNSFFPKKIKISCKNIIFVK